MMNEIMNFPIVGYIGQNALYVAVLIAEVQ